MFLKMGRVSYPLETHTGVVTHEIQNNLESGGLRAKGARGTKLAMTSTVGKSRGDEAMSCC